MKSLNIKYIPAIDHLRAVGGLLILAYHGLHLFSYEAKFHRPIDFEHYAQPTAANPLWALIIEGHTAVALFMVLSGFIFTYGTAGHSISYRQFIRNRLLRIYPLFLLLVMTGISFFPQNFTLSGFFQTLLCLSNLPGALLLGPFSAMFWTIAVECQFYLIFPFLSVFLQRNGTGYFLGLIGLLLFFKTLGTLMGVNMREMAYFTILGRLDQFLLGMVTARIYLKREDKTKERQLIFFPALVLVLLLLFVLNRMGGWPSQTNWKMLWPGLEGAAWALVIYGYLGAAEKLPPYISRSWATIGEISYSIYLLHFLIIDAVLKSGWMIQPIADPYWNAMLNTTVLVLPLVLLLSSITYRMIEKPFLSLRKSYIENGNNHESFH